MQKIFNKNYINVLILSAAILILYSISLDYDFFKAWDDQIYILNNTARLNLSISNIYYWLTHTCVGCYLPFTMLTYMIDYTLFGLNSFVFHIENIIWFILSVISVYYCMKELGVKQTTALVVCMIFAVHPQRVESVVWISERKDVVCAAFYFSSILLYIKSKKKLSFLLFLFALFAKPMAISLPVILFCYELNIKSSFKIKESLIKVYPFILLAAVFIPLTFLAQGSAVNGKIYLSERMLTAIYNFFWYIKQTLLPQNLNPIYPPIYYWTANTISFAILAIIILILLSFLLIKYKKNFVLVLACYLFSLAPVSGFIKLGFTDRADRYSLIPSVFIWLGIALIGELVIKQQKFDINKRKIVVIIISFYLVTFIFINVQYQKIWGSFDSLVNYACSDAVANPLALRQLAEKELKNNNIQYSEYALKMLLSLNSNYKYNPYYKYNLSAIYYIEMNIAYKKRNIKKALYFFNKNAEIIKSSDPYYKEYLAVGASCYLSVGNQLQSNKIFNLIINNTGATEFEKNYYSGVKAYLAGQYFNAMLFFNKAYAVNPTDKNLLINIKRTKKRIKELQNQSSHSLAPSEILELQS